MSSGGILTALIFTPLIGALFVLLQRDERSIWNSAFIFSLLPLALSFYLFHAYDPYRGRAINSSSNITGSRNSEFLITSAWMASAWCWWC